VSKADNLTAICEPIVYRKCGGLDVSQPYGPSRPVTGIAVPFFNPFHVAGPITYASDKKVKLSPCLTNHYAMKTFGGVDV
jgi:hypothetical protein